MEVSYEVDWMAAWYNVWNIYDATINFWMTATFAVIVAVHALGERATNAVTRPIAALYAVFSIYTIIRALGILQETEAIFWKVADPSIDLFENYGPIPWGSISDMIILFLFVVGSIYTTYFVLTAPKRAGI